MTKHKAPEDEVIIDSAPPETEKDEGEIPESDEEPLPELKRTYATAASLWGEKKPEETQQTTPSEQTNFTKTGS